MPGCPGWRRRLAREGGSFDGGGRIIYLDRGRYRGCRTRLRGPRRVRIRSEHGLGVPASQRGALARAIVCGRRALKRSVTKSRATQGRQEVVSRSGRRALRRGSGIAQSPATLVQVIMTPAELPAAHPSGRHYCPGVALRSARRSSTERVWSSRASGPNTLATAVRASPSAQNTRAEKARSAEKAPSPWLSAHQKNRPSASSACRTSQLVIV